MAELELDPVKNGWRLTINAADVHGWVETSSLPGLAEILAAYGKFRLAHPSPVPGAEDSEPT